MPRAGDTVEGYRVEALVGRRPTGDVYRVRHLALDSLHDLHVLETSAPSDRQRLLAEGRLQLTIRHPNLVAVSDVLVLNGVPALVRESVDATPLQRWLQAHRHVSLAEAFALFRGIVTGVAVAHQQGLIHRNLTPSNILVGPAPNQGFVARVTDFGLVLAGDGTTGADLRALGRVLRALLRDKPAGEDLSRLIRDLNDHQITSCTELWGRLWADPVPGVLRHSSLAEAALDAPFSSIPKHRRTDDGLLAPAPTLVPAEEDGKATGLRSALQRVRTLGISAGPPAATRRAASGGGVRNQVQPPLSRVRSVVDACRTQPLWVWPAALAASLQLAVIPFAILLLGFSWSPPNRAATAVQPTVAAHLASPAIGTVSVQGDATGAWAR